MLSEDLQNAEKKVELLKTVLQNMVKKLSVLLQAHNITDQEKRLVSLIKGLTFNNEVHCSIYGEIACTSTLIIVALSLT